MNYFHYTSLEKCSLIVTLFRQFDFSNKEVSWAWNIHKTFCSQLCSWSAPQNKIGIPSHVLCGWNDVTWKKNEIISTSFPFYFVWVFLGYRNFCRIFVGWIALFLFNFIGKYCKSLRKIFEKKNLMWKTSFFHITKIKSFIFCNFVFLGSY